MRGIDFTSWQSIATTILGLILVSILGVGIRLVLMQTVQQRRERANRQINERLRTLIAAYKVLGGSFTGDLEVNPSHLRQSRQAGEGEAGLVIDAGSDRARRIRDAVEAALSDIILLGTEDQAAWPARRRGTWCQADGSIPMNSSSPCETSSVTPWTSILSPAISTFRLRARPVRAAPRPRAARAAAEGRGEAAAAEAEAWGAEWAAA